MFITVVLVKRSESSGREFHKGIKEFFTKSFPKTLYFARAKKLKETAVFFSSDDGRIHELMAGCHPFYHQQNTHHTIRIRECSVLPVEQRNCFITNLSEHPLPLVS